MRALPAEGLLFIFRSFPYPSFFLFACQTPQEQVTKGGIGMNSTAYRPPLTPSGRQRIRDEQARLRRRQAAATERLKQELQDKDDLNWYLTQEELGQIQSRLEDLE